MNQTRISHTGAILIPLENGTYTVHRCFDLVRDFSLGSPEPDSFSDTFRDVECGAVVRTTSGSTTDTTCDFGHQHVSYDDPGYAAHEAEYAYQERHRDEHTFDPTTSLAHIG